MNTKKIALTASCIIAIGLGVFVVYSFIPRTVTNEIAQSPYLQPFEPFPIAFSSIGESLYDPTVFYDELGYVKGSDCTQCEFIREPGNEHLAELSVDMKFDMPADLDFQNHSYILSYGRRIVGLEAIEKNGNDYVLSVTFEEEHQGNKVFINQLDKTPIYPFRWPWYILRGNGKVYCGVDGLLSDGGEGISLNEIDMEHPRRMGAK